MQILYFWGVEILYLLIYMLHDTYKKHYFHILPSNEDSYLQNDQYHSPVLISLIPLCSRLCQHKIMLYKLELKLHVQFSKFYAGTTNTGTTNTGTLNCILV